MSDFSAASNFVISNSQFINLSQNHDDHGTPRSHGLQFLLNHTTPDATHNSFARFPPPRCFPGTRKKCLEEIATWALNPGSTHRILLLTGPAGAGKSALAQSSAELLHEHLGATYFFSRHRDRDDPIRFIPTIAYQLASSLRIPSYSKNLQDRLLRDPALVTKSIATQFDELILAPFRGATMPRDLANATRTLVIIDGLDECKGNGVQYEIVRLIINSVKDETCPLLWMISSREEAHFMSAFSEPDICETMSLTMSPDVDEDIYEYLRESLKEETFRPGWPTDHHIRRLVHKSAGLFIFAATVVRFLGDSQLQNAEEHLDNLLSSNSSGLLVELDIFYRAIMQRIPEKSLPMALTTLLITIESRHSQRAPTILEIANLLGLSSRAVSASLSAIRSLISLDVASSFYGNKPIEDHIIRFYHTSFVEFLGDPVRSREFCLYQPPLFLLWAKRCFQVLREGEENWDQINLTNWPNKDFEPERVRHDLKSVIYRQAGHNSIPASTSAGLRAYPELLRELKHCNYRRLAESIGVKIWEADLVTLIDQLPKNSILSACLVRPSNLLQFWWNRITLRAQKANDSQTRFSFAHMQIGYGSKSALLDPGYRLKVNSSERWIRYSMRSPDVSQTLQ
ncbi:hypothetical protein NP233_g9788 [Leucocoprinus birnbaumii]|uniref:NACHT domain-containing protein n=1 Tax=Leucocoprinus birnbaumii TaxID=56174 RepID=A0AAD5YSI4_9AGAR|nr:hypothetical protein NP233_g9788 [Leucocoprinus birnbaumii]